MEFFIRLTDDRFFRCEKLQEVVIGMIGMINAKMFLKEENRWIPLKPKSVIAFPVEKISEMEIVNAELPKPSTEPQPTQEPVQG